MLHPQLITLLGLIRDTTLDTKERTEHYRFTPESPYDHYLRGIVFTQKRRQNFRQRYVVLTAPTKEIYTFPARQSLAKYAIQVQLWKTQHYAIPLTHGIGYRNNDPMDDRMDNYQLRTHQEYVDQQRLWHRYNKKISREDR